MSVKTVLFVFRIASLKVRVIFELTVTSVSESDGLKVIVGATVSATVNVIDEFDIALL